MSQAVQPLLRHVVLFAFTESAEPGHVGAIERGFAALPSQVPGIVDFEWGTDVSPEGLADGFTHCFTVTFDSAAGRDAYLVHPAHQAFVTTLKPHLAKALVVDYWAGRP